MTDDGRRQVSWLPGPSSTPSRAHGPVARATRLCTTSPVTVAGPRRIRTGFPSPPTARESTARAPPRERGPARGARRGGRARAGAGGSPSAARRRRVPAAPPAPAPRGPWPAAAARPRRRGSAPRRALARRRRGTSSPSRPSSMQLARAGRAVEADHRHPGARTPRGARAACPRSATQREDRGAGAARRRQVARAPGSTTRPVEPERADEPLERRAPRPLAADAQRPLRVLRRDRWPNARTSRSNALLRRQAPGRHDDRPRRAPAPAARTGGPTFGMQTHRAPDPPSAAAWSRRSRSVSVTTASSRGVPAR